MAYILPMGTLMSKNLMSKEFEVLYFRHYCLWPVKCDERFENYSACICPGLLGKTLQSIKSPPTFSIQPTQHLSFLKVVEIRFGQWRSWWSIITFINHHWMNKLIDWVNCLDWLLFHNMLSCIIVTHFQSERQTLLPNSRNQDLRAL